jgi:hypothetical protein
LRSKDAQGTSIFAAQARSGNKTALCYNFTRNALFLTFLVQQLEQITLWKTKAINREELMLYLEVVTVYTCIPFLVVSKVHN